MDLKTGDIKMDHPELTTFSAVIRFTASLEVEAANQYERWEKASARADAFRSLAASHRQRAVQLNRIVQEHLNEMILEPISGLRAQDYEIPKESETANASGDPIALAVELEARLGRLYEDLVERAGRALGGAAQSLARYAAQCSRASQELARL